MIRQFPLILAAMLLSISMLAQSWNGTSLFRPRLSLGYEAMANMPLNDSVSFQSGETSFTGLIPLRVSAGAKKLRPKVKVDLLSFSMAVRTADVVGLENFHSLGRASFGWTGIRAGLGTGLWVYILQGGISMSMSDPEKNFPYLTAGFGRVIIRGIKRQTLIGGGIYAARNLILPFPIIGFNRIINTKSGIVTVLPVYFNYWYSPADKLKFSGTLSLGGFNNAFSPGIPSALLNAGFGPDDITLRVGYARTGARFEWRPFSNLWFSLEGGGDFFKKVSFVQNREVIYSDRIPVQPYLKGGLTFKIPPKDSKIPWPEF